MENKIEKWLEKRGQDAKEIFKDITKWRMQKCESPIEELFFIEWEYQMREENCQPEGFSKFYIIPQYEVNRKYRVDFLISYISENDWFSYKENYNNIKDKILIIELDSYLWHGSDPAQFTKEKERERELKKEGWDMMRFSGREIYNNVEKCVEEVIRYLRSKEEKEL